MEGLIDGEDELEGAEFAESYIVVQNIESPSQVFWRNVWNAFGLLAAIAFIVWIFIPLS